MDLFESLGFSWERKKAQTDFPAHSKEVVCFDFHKNMASFVWDASALEGNPCTLPQVQTLMSGITVGGLRLSDQQQVVNLAQSCKELLKLVKTGQFTLDRPTSLRLHGILAKDEALEWGVFRGEGKEAYYTPHVALGEAGSHTPHPTEAGGGNLIRLFEQGIDALNRDCANPFEKGGAFFLFGALQQFFFDGNKRTARLMMNGVMMSNGINALSIPAAKLQDFNEKMVRFYVGKDATEMFDFLIECHPESKLANHLEKKAGLSLPAKNHNAQPRSV